MASAVQVFKVIPTQFITPIEVNKNFEKLRFHIIFFGKLKPLDQKRFLREVAEISALYQKGRSVELVRNWSERALQDFVQATLKTLS